MAKIGDLFKKPPDHVPASNLQMIPEIGLKDPLPSIPHPGNQPVPVLSTPNDPPLMQAPALSKPVAPPFMPAPPLSRPVDPPFMPAPPLRQPVAPPFMPAPPLRVPVDPPFMPAPPPGINVPQPFMPAPPPGLNVPQPFMPAPPPGVNVPQPFMTAPPPGVNVPQPFMENPPLRQPNPIAGTIQVYIPAPFRSNIPHAGEQPTMKLGRPKPVKDIETGFTLENYLGEWTGMLEKQQQFIAQEIPKLAKMMFLRNLPHPGDIPVELTVSGLAGVAAEKASQLLRTQRNRYTDALGDEGLYVNMALIGATPSLNATRQAYEDHAAIPTYNEYYGEINTQIPGETYPKSDISPSMKKINDAGFKDTNISAVDLFEKEGKRIKLKADYRGSPESDIKSNTFMGNGYVPMRYKFDFDEENGNGLSMAHTTSKEIDDMMHLPFYFVDLRPYVKQDEFISYKKIAFHPFNLRINESISPQWSKQNYLGRVDPVATYQSTNRTLSLTFMLIAFHPADLKVIYNKLKWLTALVYPEYDGNMRYKSGPVAKLRVGNIINAKSSNIPLSKDIAGVPGIIESLDFDYNDGIWEIEDDWQVPRQVKVSLSFTVMHELPVGVLNGEFGAIGMFSDDEKTRFISPVEAYERDSNASAISSFAQSTDDQGFRQVGPFVENGRKLADAEQPFVKPKPEPPKPVPQKKLPPKVDVTRHNHARTSNQPVAPDQTIFSTGIPTVKGTH